MRHRRILELAAENPGASMAELADAVPSATTELVERVLEAHGDPADDGAGEGTPDAETDAPDSNPTAEAGPASDGGTGSADGTETAADGAGPSRTEEVSDGDASDSADADSGTESDDAFPSPEDLSERQREVLRAVAARPEATQREIGDRLGVTAATVSNRVSDVDGLEWRDRAAFVREIGIRPASADGGSEDRASGAGAGTRGEESPSSTSGSPGSGEGAGPGEDGSADVDDADRHGESDSDGPDEEAVAAALDRLTESVADVERRVASVDERVTAVDDRLTAVEGGVSEPGSRDPGTDGSASENGLDPELLHKVVHAVVNSDAVSEDEELRVLRELV